MTAKQLLFGETAHARLIRGMNILADAVRVTLGPKRARWCWRSPGARPR
jgi:chaperonin GroEL